MPTRSIEPNERITFKVHHEDVHLLVVAKPSGVVTAPGIGHERDSLLNGLFARFGDRLQNLGAKRDFGLCHRLDRETSGLVVIALSRDAYDGVRAQFEARAVRKLYWAVCHAGPKRGEGVVRLPIREEVRRKDRYTSIKLARIARAGKPALTAYRVLQRSDVATVVEARPVTGRLHQVRLHLDAIGAPVLGDPTYAPRLARDLAPRLALHAHRLALRHPITGDPLDVRTPWPRDLRNLLRKLKLDRPDLATGGAPDPAGESSELRHHLGGDPIGEEEP